MKRLSQTTIRARILAAMLLAGGVPLLLITGQSLHCAREGILVIQAQHLATSLSKHRVGLDTWLEERANGLRQISRCPTLQNVLATPEDDRNRALIRSYLDEVLVGQPFLQSLGVFDTDLRVLVQGSDSHHHGVDLLDDDLVRQLRDATEVVVSQYHHDHGQGDMAVHMGYPIPGERQGSVAGYLVASVTFHHVVAALHQAPPGHTLRTFVLSDSGRYISVPEGMAEQLGEVADLPASLRAGGLSGLEAYRDHRGHKVLGMSLPLESLGWRLLVQMDEQEALGTLYFLMRRATMSMVVVALLILVLSLVVARFLARPFQQLTGFCDAIAAGSSQRQLPDVTGREARELACAFEQMLAELDAGRDELVQAGSLAAVGELTASVVHEMRNPLNTISMNLEALHGKLTDDPRLGELYDLATRQTRRLQDMLNSLLSFGSPVQLERREWDLRDILGELAEDLAPAAAAQNVALQVEVGPAPVCARVDREHFYRTVVNLVENAVQAQPEGGEVRVGLERVADACVVTVQDHGPGIPPGMHDKVFRPFFTTRADGTGLGLSIVKKIVSLHGGTVDFVPGPDGTGTTCNLRIPDSPRGTP